MNHWILPAAETFYLKLLIERRDFRFLRKSSRGFINIPLIGHHMLVCPKGVKGHFSTFTIGEARRTTCPSVDVARQYLDIPVVYFEHEGATYANSM